MCYQGLSLALVSLLVSVSFGDVQVNTYVTSDQCDARITTCGANGFSVVWASKGQDGSYSGVYGQRFDHFGAAQGGEFQVNVTTFGTQRQPDVAMDLGGSFVVAWQSADADLEGIWGRRYAADGTPRGGEFQINSYEANRQLYPRLSMSNSGAFMTAWQSNLIAVPDGHSAEWYTCAQAYDANGMPTGSESVVNLLPHAHYQEPMVDPAGGWLVGFTRSGDSGHLPLGDSMLVRRFNESGVAREDPVTLLSSGTGGFASDGSGNVLITYYWDYATGDENDIWGQWFTPSFEPRGSAFRVNSTTLGDQGDPHVAVNRQGQAIIAWWSGHEGNGFDLFAQAYDVDGTPLGEEFRLNDEVTGNQFMGDLTLNDDGWFGAVWHSSDGYGSGVFADFGQIPEPSTAILLALSGLRCFRWRRREIRRRGRVLR